MNIDANFESDWNKIIRDELDKHFSSSEIPTNDRDAEILYFNFLHRSIQIKPRNIVGETDVNVPSHLKDGFDLLLEKVKNGENLNFHLSRGRKKLDYNDGLLNDWGVFHFHLGTTLENDSYINRTGELLFALVDTNNFYCINMYDHSSWTNLEVVKEIHRKFPHTISMNILKGVVGLSHVPTNEDIKNLRRAGCNTMLQMDDGTIYASLGGGYMTDGTSTNVIIFSDHWKRHVRNLEKKLPDIINNELKDISFTHSPISCNLQIHDNEICIYFDEPNLLLKINVRFPVI